MRNYNDNKIVLTSGSDVAQMLRAYSLAPDVPVMAVQPERHIAAAPPRRKAVEIEILRNGKSSESVSFVNEAAADFDGSSKSAGHIRKAAVKSRRKPAPTIRPTPAPIRPQPWRALPSLNITTWHRHSLLRPARRVR